MDALDLIRVTVKMAQYGQTFLNVYHMVSASSIGDDEVLENGGLSSVMETLYSILRVVQHHGLSYESVAAYNVSSDFDFGEVSFPTLVEGAIASTVGLPAQCAGLVVFPTGVSRRRGRKFIPGFTETDQGDGLWGANVTDALEDYATLLLDPIMDDNANLWIYVVANESLELGSTSQPTGAIITNNPSTLTRRRIGRGM